MLLSPGHVKSAARAPTRDDTKEKLFEAAAEVFEQQGIGAASIEAIAAAAGMTRGAFCSRNFREQGRPDHRHARGDHVERSLKHHRELLAKHIASPRTFIAALVQQLSAAGTIRWAARRSCTSR